MTSPRRRSRPRRPGGATCLHSPRSPATAAAKARRCCRASAGLTSMLWVPLQAGVMRAGSFDDVRPRLGRGDIMARAAGFYTLGGAPRERADNRIPPRWWEWQLRDVDPAAGRASFNMELGDR